MLETNGTLPKQLKEVLNLVRRWVPPEKMKEVRTELKNRFGRANLPRLYYEKTTENNYWEYRKTMSRENAAERALNEDNFPTDDVAIDNFIRGMNKRQEKRLKQRNIKT